MRGREVLWRVELPNALPLIIGGVRSAVLQVISTATIAAYVGLGGLGRYIFDGLAQRDFPQMIGGLDPGRAARHRRRPALGGAPEGHRLARPAGRSAQRPAPAARDAHHPSGRRPCGLSPSPRAGGTDHETLPDRPCPGLAAAASLALTACGGGGDPLKSGSGSGGGGGRRRHDRRRLGQLHREPDPRRDLRPGAAGQGRQGRPRSCRIGSREAYFPGLQDGSIDLIPEYTGVLLQYLNKSATETEPDAVYAALQKALPATLTVLDKSSGRGQGRGRRHQGHGHEVQRHARSPTWPPTAGSSCSAGRRSSRPAPTASRASQKTYNCTFKEYKALDAGGPLTVAALKNGDVQAADIFTTDAVDRGQQLRRPRGPEEQLRGAERRAADQQGQGDRHGHDRRSTRSRRSSPPRSSPTSTPRRRRTRSRARRPSPRTGSARTTSPRAACPERAGDARDCPQRGSFEGKSRSGQSRGRELAAVGLRGTPGSGSGRSLISGGSALSSVVAWTSRRGPPAPAR